MYLCVFFHIPLHGFLYFFLCFFCLETKIKVSRLGDWHGI